MSQDNTSSVVEVRGLTKHFPGLAVPDLLAETRPVVERAHGDAGAEQVGDLHGEIHTRGRPVQRQAEIGGTVTRTLEIANVGHGPLTVLSIASPTAAVIVNDAETTIVAGSSAFFDVSWTPESQGVLGGELTITSDDPFGTQTTVGLSGLAEGAPPAAEISPPSVEAALPPYSDFTKSKTIVRTPSGSPISAATACRTRSHASRLLASPRR